MQKLGQKGTTLVELIVSLAILSIILSPISLVIYLGYKDFYVESENMNAQQNAKEVLDKILEDLRMYENEHTKVDNSVVKTLIIKDNIHFPGDELIYTYLPDQKMVYRNSSPVLEGIETEVVDFGIEETILNYDTWVIDVDISIKVSKSDIIKLQTSYRTKVKLLPTPT
jgi:prepilin-type N-terminal cleavage/methylation domain-containing protein